MSSVKSPPEFAAFPDLGTRSSSLREAMPGSVQLPLSRSAEADQKVAISFRSQSSRSRKRRECSQGVRAARQSFCRPISPPLARHNRSLPMRSAN